MYIYIWLFFCIRSYTNTHTHIYQFLILEENTYSKILLPFIFRQWDHGLNYSLIFVLFFSLYFSSIYLNIKLFLTKKFFQFSFISTEFLTWQNDVTLNVNIGINKERNYLYPTPINWSRKILLLKWVPLCKHVGTVLRSRKWKFPWCFASDESSGILGWLFQEFFHRTYHFT